MINYFSVSYLVPTRIEINLKIEWIYFQIKNAKHKIFNKFGILFIYKRSSSATNMHLWHNNNNR